MGSSEAAGACGGKKKAVSPLFISGLPPLRLLRHRLRLQIGASSASIGRHWIRL
jgi:hypothetical protein